MGTQPHAPADGDLELQPAEEVEVAAAAAVHARDSAVAARARNTVTGELPPLDFADPELMLRELAAANGDPTDRRD